MKKLLFAIFASLAISSAYADPANVDKVTSIDVSSLTADQKAALLADVTKLKGASSDTKGISETVRGEAEKWGELGTNMGKAAVGAAREVGVAANEFVSTPLGKITMGIVVYKIVGKEVVHFATGLGVLVFFFSLAIYFIRKKPMSSVAYEYKPTLFGLYNKKVVTSYTVDDNWGVAYMIAAAICAALGMLIGLNTMF